MAVQNAAPEHRRPEGRHRASNGIWRPSMTHHRCVQIDGSRGGIPMSPIRSTPALGTIRHRYRSADLAPRRSVPTIRQARAARFGQPGAMSSPTRGSDRSGGFRIEVMPAPRYQTVIDSIMVPISWLVSWLALEPPALRRNRDTFRVIVRNRRGEWRALRITSSEEAKRVRDETQARIESVGIEAWSREMRGRIPESFFR